jgi:predicted nucleotidyltransferase
MMDASEAALPPNYQATLDRFVAACRADARVVAAFLGGSYARGTADAYSDLDLGLITTDAAYVDFFAEREAFIRVLGVPLFLEDWNGSGVDILFFIFPDGVEGELALGRESHFAHIHAGPYRVLLDNGGILANAVFPVPEPTVDPAAQRATIHRQIYWFWHDLSHHFITPLARGELWGAYGCLEEMRRTCVNLARLRHNSAAALEGLDGYEKVEYALPVGQLAPLASTMCPLVRGAMLKAAGLIVDFYRELASELARAHGVAYPTDLDRMMAARLGHLTRANRR